MRFTLAFLLILTACSPSSIDDFKQEGEARCRRLVRLLESVQDHEDLLKKEPDLKKEFTKLIDLVIEARTYQLENPEQVPALEESPLSDDLKEQMIRVYHIDGGREIMERAQREPLLKLDSFEKKIIQRKPLKK